MMGDFDFKKMGNELALALMIRRRIREPTLSQIQLNSENSHQEHFSSTPAWLRNSSSHPGLPEHYLTLSTIENELKPAEDDEQLPELPFEVNRTILYKMMIVPKERQRSKQLKRLPKLIELMNGTILIVGPPLAEEIEHNVEIFLNLHDKLLPCCYATTQIITWSPTTPEARARCYYLPETSATPEITFLSSEEKVLFKCYQLSTFFTGSTQYENLHS